jgi:hypothetical protein
MAKARCWTNVPHPPRPACLPATSRHYRFRARRGTGAAGAVSLNAWQAAPNQAEMIPRLRRKRNTFCWKLDGARGSKQIIWLRKYSDFEAPLPRAAMPDGTRWYQMVPDIEIWRRAFWLSFWDFSSCYQQLAAYK